MADGPKLTPAEMDRIRQIISHKARAFVRTRHEREDAEQEIWLRIVRRLRSYDAARASLMTFLFHVIESATRDVRRKVRKERRGPKTNLNDAAQRDGDERVSLFSAEQQEFALGHRRTSAEEQVDLALDTAEVIDTLPAEFRTLCDLLRESTAAVVADRLQISRATLYRLLHIAREHLEDHRLDEYLG